MKVPLCWGDFPEGFSRKGHRGRRGWIWEPVFWIKFVLFLCGWAYFLYLAERQLWKFCSGWVLPNLWLHLGRDNTTVSFRVNCWFWSSQKPSTNILLKLHESLLCCLYQLWDTVMATRGPWGGGGVWNITLLWMYCYKSLLFFFFSPGKMKQTNKKNVLSVRKMNLIPNFSQHLAQCLV